MEGITSAIFCPIIVSVRTLCLDGWIKQCNAVPTAHAHTSHLEFQACLVRILGGTHLLVLPTRTAL